MRASQGNRRDGVEGQGGQRSGDVQGLDACTGEADGVTVNEVQCRLSGVTGRQSEHQQGVRTMAVDHMNLGPRQRDGVAICRRSHGYSTEAVNATRFIDSSRDCTSARGYLWKQFSLLLLAGRDQDRRDTERDGREQRARHDAASKLLDGDSSLDHRCCRTAVLLRYEQTRQPQFPTHARPKVDVISRRSCYRLANLGQR